MNKKALPLQCPQCQSGILAQQIDEQLQATCQQCGATFSVAGQLKGLLAYHHPKETKLAPPPSLRLEHLPDETVQITLSQPLSAPLPWPLGALTAPAGYLNKVVITANRAQLALHDMPLPRLVLNKKQFAAGQIEQLYLQKTSFTSPVRGNLRPQYELWALLREHRTELLLQLEDWTEALYLEQTLEAALELADRPVDDEVSYLSPAERHQLLAWWPLAESLSLDFIPQRGGGYFTGLYRGHQLRLDAFPQPYGTRFNVYTRLALYDEELLQRKVPPEEPTPPVAPPTLDILQSLLIPPGWETDLKGSLEIQSDAHRIYYEQILVETDPAYLKFLFDLLSHLAEAYPQILAWGGAAVPALQEMTRLKPRYLSLIASQLLNEIRNETKRRLSVQASQKWCPHCLVRRVGQIEVQDSWPRQYYYGCQICGQSRTFFRGRVVAVLDEQMEADQIEEGRERRVNWLHYRRMFDFDEVRILRADDEAVERLAMQMGNDTDPHRDVQRKTTTCIVSPECRLSENTWKILQRTFWQVKQGS